MGTHVQFRDAPAMPAEQLKNWYQGLVDELRYQKGNDYYGGDWQCNSGLSISHLTFKTEKEAVAYLEPRLDKGGCVIAVKIGDFEKTVFPLTATDKKLVERHAELDRQLKLYEFDIVERARNQKSVMKGCDHCQSKVNLKKLPRLQQKDFLGTVARMTDMPSSDRVYGGFGRYMWLAFRDVLSCPVCGGKPFLETATDVKRYKTLQENVADLTKKVAAARSAHDQKIKAKGILGHWLLGGASPS